MFISGTSSTGEDCSGEENVIQVRKEHKAHVRNRGTEMEGNLEA